MGILRVKPVKNNNKYNAGYGKYYMIPHPNPTIDVEDLAYHISLDSGVERSKVAEITRAIVKQIDELLCNGHAIRIPHLGLLKLGVKSKGSETASGFKAGVEIQDIHMILLPNKEIKEELDKMRFEKFYYEDALAKKEKQNNG